MALRFAGIMFCLSRYGIWLSLRFNLGLVVEEKTTEFSSTSLDSMYYFRQHASVRHTGDELLSVQ